MHDLSSEQPSFYPETAVYFLNSMQSVIAVDDHCYQLRNWVPGQGWRPSTYWFSEAVQAVKHHLPEDPDYALEWVSRPSGTL